MRNLPSLALALALVSLAAAPAAQAGDKADKAEKAANTKDFPAAEAPNVVREEYARTQTELQNAVAQAKKRLVDLEAAKTKAFAQAQTLAQQDAQGMKSLQDIETLINTRHTDEKGEFQPGAELAAQEVASINKLFGSFLHMTPLEGRVSAGHAKRTIEWGLDRLNELQKVHSSPSESNNPEMEIIATQTKDAEAEIKRVMDKADKLGMKLNPDAALVTSSSGDGPRAPAMIKK